MRIKKIKSVFAGLLASAMVFGAAATASAFWADDGDFVIGIVGPNQEYACEMGLIDFLDPAGKYIIPEKRYENLWNFSDIGSTFTGVSSLSDLRVNGFSQVSQSSGEVYGYFAVQKGTTPVVNESSMQEFITKNKDVNTYHNTGLSSPPSASFMPSDASQSVDWSWGEIGRYGTFIYNEIGQELLTDLAVGSPVELEIWMAGDDNFGYGEGWDYVWDHPASKTNYLVRVGVDEVTGMVYAETAAVPIPAAVWLLGSGILAIIGIRSRNA